MTTSLLSDLLSGNATSDQYAGLVILAGAVFAALVWNLREQREGSKRGDL